MTDEKTINEEEQLNTEVENEEEISQESSEEQKELEPDTKKQVAKRKPKPCKAPKQQKSEFDREYFSDKSDDSDIKLEKKFEKWFNEKINPLLPQAIEMTLENRNVELKKDQAFESFRKEIQDDTIVDTLRSALKDKPLEEITETLNKIGKTFTKKVQEREGYILEQYNPTKTVTYSRTVMDDLMDPEKATAAIMRGMQSVIPNFQKKK